MRIIAVPILSLLIYFSAAAQTSPNAQASQKVPQNFQIPPGWILIMPSTTEGTSGPQQKGFQLPKDWAAQRPAGVPVGKDWPYMLPLANAAASANQDLIKLQTEAITYLSQRIDKLDARVKELEAQGGSKK